MRAWCTGRVFILAKINRHVEDFDEDFKDDSFLIQTDWLVQSFDQRLKAHRARRQVDDSLPRSQHVYNCVLCQLLDGFNLVQHWLLWVFVNTVRARKNGKDLVQFDGGAEVDSDLWVIDEQHESV